MTEKEKNDHFLKYRKMIYSQINHFYRFAGELKDEAFCICCELYCKCLINYRPIKNVSFSTYFYSVLKKNKEMLNPLIENEKTILVDLGIAKDIIDQSYYHFHRKMEFYDNVIINLTKECRELLFLLFNVEKRNKKTGKLNKPTFSIIEPIVRVKYNWSRKKLKILWQELSEWYNKNYIVGEYTFL